MKDFLILALSLSFLISSSNRLAYADFDPMPDFWLDVEEASMTLKGIFPKFGNLDFSLITVKPAGLDPQSLGYYGEVVVIFTRLTKRLEKNYEFEFETLGTGYITENGLKNVSFDDSYFPANIITVFHGTICINQVTPEIILVNAQPIPLEFPESGEVEDTVLHVKNLQLPHMHTHDIRLKLLAGGHIIYDSWIRGVEKDFCSMIKGKPTTYISGKEKDRRVHLNKQKHQLYIQKLICINEHYSGNTAFCESSPPEFTEKKPDVDLSTPGL